MDRESRPPRARAVSGFDHPGTTKTWDALYYGDPLSLRFYDSAIQRVVSLLRPAPEERLLDAGCGAGVHAIRAARAGCQVDAIDFSRAALEDAAERARHAGLADRIHFAFGDLTGLAIPDGHYTTVFSWGVLIHIREIEKAMDELVRILAVGGRLALYVSNLGALQPRAARLKHRVLEDGPAMDRFTLGFGTRVELQGEPIWVWYNDIDAIVEYLRKRGLRLVSRQAGEFCDLHLRTTGAVRRAFLRLNNFWFDRGLPARLAYMNLLVFEKGPGGGHRGSGAGRP